MTQDSSENAWFDDYADYETEIQVDEYDITAVPNDFNIATISSFLESGAFRIPGFQRNYVWDIGRASKLIESLILGLPVPQIFLYESNKNQFLVIDGQQRLMSIYYFIKMRFPRKEKRTELRSIFDEHGKIPEDIVHSDEYFESFKLKLSNSNPNNKNKFKGLNYATLGDYKTQFDMRTIRNVIIKQNSPQDDDSSMYEIFNRLNTGGITLRPQEIRTSMYHSEFYDILYKVNTKDGWRKILGGQTPDLHMKDVEILLRGFAMLIDGDSYSPSMVKFLNNFSRKSKSNSQEDNHYLYTLAESFITACSDLPEDAFINKKNRRFNVALYEATFAGVCNSAFNERRLIEVKIPSNLIESLENDGDFVAATQEGTTQTRNVEIRLRRAKEILHGL